MKKFLPVTELARDDRFTWISEGERFKDPDVLFAAPFREIRRWPWKRNEWVRLYELERP